MKSHGSGEDLQADVLGLVCRIAIDGQRTNKVQGAVQFGGLLGQVDVLLKTQVLDDRLVKQYHLVEFIFKDYFFFIVNLAKLNFNVPVAILLLCRRLEGNIFALLLN